MFSFLAPTQIRLPGVRGRWIHQQTFAKKSPFKRDIRVGTATEDFEITSDLAQQDGVDFYAVLGVSPNADNQTIKKAYHRAIRDYHPDVSFDDEATEFCIFLNEVYETLSDPEKRAAYDEIAGFQSSAINPFFDDSYPTDQVFVDEFTCIGCKNCTHVCPKTFGLEDDFGRARVFKQKGEKQDLIQEAIDTCPVSCIHWVSAPQLALLESAMARIERVSAYILMMGCSVGADVFQEAIRSFERRQQEMRSRREASEQQSWMEEMDFTMHANGNGNGEATTDFDVKKRATAAQAAASARRWRDYQRNVRDKATLRLPESTNN